MRRARGLFLLLNVLKLFPIQQSGVLQLPLLRAAYSMDCFLLLLGEDRFRAGDVSNVGGFGRVRKICSFQSSARHRRIHPPAHLQ